MPVIILKPTTAGRRNASTNTFAEITKKTPEKALCIGKKRIDGRNNEGVKSIRHRGGGHKRSIRNLDTLRTDKAGVPAKVAGIEYDPNRTAFIALLHYVDGEKRYIIAPKGLTDGDEVMTGERAKIKVGNRMQVQNIPLGYAIHDVEIKKNQGAKLVKSAGSSARLTALDGEMAQITLPSGEVRYVHKDCYATIGEVSNGDHMLVRLGKAGRKRWLGRKPEVLGKSMNACDHPHGGGEGHNPIGLKAPKTKWGAKALGVRTRRPKKYSNKFIAVSRHRAKSGANK